MWLNFPPLKYRRSNVGTKQFEKLRGDAYRGRMMVGMIRAMGIDAWLSEEIAWSEGAMVATWQIFVKYQETNMYNRQNASCVAKMLIFMESEGDADPDPTSAIHPNSHRISMGQDRGLVSSRQLLNMRCRLACCSLESDDSVCEGDDRRANIFRTCIKRLEGMTTVNSRKLSQTISKNTWKLAPKVWPSFSTTGPSHSQIPKSKQNWQKLKNK